MEVKEWTPNDYYSFEDLNRIEYNILQMGLLLRNFTHDDYLIGNHNLLPSLGGDNYDLKYVYHGDRPYTTIEYYGDKWLKYFRNDDGYPSFRLSSVKVKPNSYYTWSFDAFTFGEGREVICSNYDGTMYGAKRYLISRDKTRISHTFKTNPNSSFEVFHIVNLKERDAYCFRNFKLEKSQVPTEWIPQNLEEVPKKVLELDMGRDMESIEFSDSLRRVESNMDYLCSLFVKPPNWEQPNIHWRPNDIFFYTDANRLEKNISGLYNLLKGTLDNFNYCGAYTCGEGVRV